MFTPSMYSGLDDITVKIFFDIASNKSYEQMFLSKVVRNVAPKIKRLLKRAEMAYIEIYHDYSEAVSTSASKNYYLVLNELDYLRHRFLMLAKLIECLNDENKEYIGKEILAWGFIFNPKGKVKDQMPTLERQMRGAQNKIRRKTSEVEDLEKNMEKSSDGLIKQKLQLQRITELTINIEKTTMKEWIEIKNIAKEIIEAQKRANRNSKANV